MARLESTTEAKVVDFMYFEVDEKPYLRWNSIQLLYGMPLARDTITRDGAFIYQLRRYGSVEQNVWKDTPNWVVEFQKFGKYARIESYAGDRDVYDRDVAMMRMFTNV